MKKNKVLTPPCEVREVIPLFLDKFFNKNTFSVASVAILVMNVFGVTLGAHDLELALGLLAASRVVDN